MISSEFKIENFCQEHYIEFKKYYNYLNNPFYISILLKCLEYITHDKIRQKILNMITENHPLVLEKINKIDIIISFYKQNNLINRSEIGKFFTFYEKSKKSININNNKDLLKLFYKLILYKNCISVLKECFYIFSDYRSCIYFLTPSINFYDTTKSIIKKVVMNFRDNINTLNQILTKKYPGDINPWGSQYYLTAYTMFESLIILQKYFKDPLEILNINFIINKKNSRMKSTLQGLDSGDTRRMSLNEIVKNLCKNYHLKKMYISKIDDKMNSKNINNISQFIVNLKRLGYDMWFVIPIVFNSIYENYELNGIIESIVIGHKKIYYQRMNNIIGIMCYILVSNNFISNVNIFKNFND